MGDPSHAVCHSDPLSVLSFLSLSDTLSRLSSLPPWSLSNFFNHTFYVPFLHICVFYLFVLPKQLNV